jgi:hypothetical protein
MHKKVFGLRAIKSRREAALNHSDATNIERSTQTDAAGYYFFAVLPVGTYDVTAEVAGFQTTKHLEAPWMPLRRSSHRRTRRSEASWTIRSQFPLLLRRWDDLFNVAAGVHLSRYTEQGGSTSAGRTGGFNVHGVRSLQNNFILDGIDNSIPEGN